MKIKNIDHIVLVVSDINEAIKFYVDILGMTPEFNGGRIALKFGSQKINLHRFAGEFKPAAKSPTYASAGLGDERRDLRRGGVGPQQGVVDEMGQVFSGDVHEAEHRAWCFQPFFARKAPSGDEEWQKTP